MPIPMPVQRRHSDDFTQRMQEWDPMYVGVPPPVPRSVADEPIRSSPMELGWDGYWDPRMNEQGEPWYPY